MAYIVPQVLVYQEFELIPGAITQPLRACLVGPIYSPLVRYSVDSEKQLGYLGVYDPAGAPSGEEYLKFMWPNRGSGKIDHSFTKLTFQDALLQYRAWTGTDSDIVPTYAYDNYKNRIRSGAGNGHGTIIFAGVDENGLDTTQEPYLLPFAQSGAPRDVQPGDIVRLTWLSGETEMEFRSYVTRLIADTEPATVAAPVVDTAVNQADVAAADFVSAVLVAPAETALVEIDDAASLAASSFDGLADGNVEEVYTLTVTTAGSAGDARLRLRSASGNDDADNIVYTGISSAITLGARGLKVKFAQADGQTGTALELGQSWNISVKQAYTAAAPSLSSGAEYTGGQDTTYVIEVIRSGTIGDPDPLLRPLLSVYTTTGVDVSGPSVAVAANNQVGSFGVEIDFAAGALVVGDRFYVDVEAEAEGQTRTLVLANRLPDELLGIAPEGESAGPIPALNLYLLVRRTVEITEARAGIAGIRNWLGEELEFGVADGITATVSDIRDADGAVVPLDVFSADMYITYRAVAQRNLRTIESVSDVSEIPDAIGVLHPDQPMAVALEKALSNSSGTPVKYLAIADNTLEAYADALEVLTGTEEVYGLVPLTFDRQVQNLFSAHVNTMSSPENGRWRITFVSTPAETTKALVTLDSAGESILATVADDPNSEQTEEYTLLDISTPAGQDPVDLISAGVTANDIVRIHYQQDGLGNSTYQEYRIDEVVANDIVRLVSPGIPAPVTRPTKVEFWRNLTTTEMVQELGVKAGSFFSRRVYNVWPDYISAAGVEYPGYVLAAAIAGQASGVVPQQGHTNLELLGFDDVSRSTELLSVTQLNILAAAGVYIVTQDPQTGKVYTRHELSTNTTDVNTKELMVTKNVDSISFVYLKTLQPFIGISNITPTLIDRIDCEIKAATTYLKTNSYVTRLGSQLIDGKITKLEQHPTLKDRLVAVVEITIPYPLNTIELHLVVPA